ncbi:MAG: hypothetical protein U5K53_06165 [Halanaerobiales bacterium]|nr:hypothetical protein [Halanaerobiales bacterium]
MFTDGNSIFPHMSNNFIDKDDQVLNLEMIISIKLIKQIFNMLNKLIKNMKNMI